MTWARIDDSFHGHPKVAGVRLDAIGLWARALSYASAYLTDGAIPHPVLPLLSGLPMARARKLADELVKVGLWERAGQDFLIHNFLRYNPSKRDVLEERERKQRAGALGARVRWGNAAAAIAPAMADGMAGRMALPAEVPCPRPDPSRPVPREQQQPPPPPPASEAGAGCGGGGQVLATDSSTWNQAEWPSPEALAAMFNRLAPDNVYAVETLSPSRVKRAKRLLELFPEKAWWEQVFREYRASRFLRGRAKPSTSHPHFRPEFDWLIATGKDGVENAVKAHDGAYADE